jgi:RNA polymerase sigma-70 factor (ECF subfamily)
MSGGKVLTLRRDLDGRDAERPPGLSDATLLAACALGDGAALGALFDRHHRSVERFIGRLAHSSAAELADLVQTTFIEVNRTARAFKGRSAVRTWIFGIAANVVRHHVRGEVRRRALHAEATSLAVTTGGAPDETVVHRQLLRRLGDALAALPSVLRETFVLCDLEDVPGAEAARVLGVREGTIWWRLHEARKRLRAAVDGGGP